MKYLGFYDTQKNRRNMSLAAVNKMNYICGALNALGHSVEVIACGMIAQEHMPETTEKLTENTIIRFFKTKKQSKHKLIRVWNILRQNVILFWYLLTQIKREESVLVYHSLGLMRSVYLAKKLKGFRLILEVEEFYNDVWLKSKISKKMEEKFIACADGYLFPTELLNQKFNPQDKPYSIVHGTYQAEPDRGKHFDDERIHVIYAGTFDPRKGGALAAVSAAKFLSPDYHVHILGFGSDNEVEKIKELVKETNAQEGAAVTYDGLLSGETYIEFLQKCQIGLSTQNPEGEYNSTSFPSKILSYMANGLRVVTIRIPAIEGSAVGGDLYYYDKQTPEEIAKAIMQVDLNDNYDSRKKIEELDKQFCNDIKALLEKEL